MRSTQALLKRMVKLPSTRETIARGSDTVSLQLMAGRVVSLEEQDKVTLIVMSQAMQHDVAEVLLRAYADLGRGSGMPFPVQIGLREHEQNKYLIAVVRVPVSHSDDIIIENSIDRLSSWISKIQCA